MHLYVKRIYISSLVPNFFFLVVNPYSQSLDLDGLRTPRYRNRDLSRESDLLGRSGALQGGSRDGGCDHEVRSDRAQFGRVTGQRDHCFDRLG